MKSDKFILLFVLIIVSSFGVYAQLQSYGAFVRGTDVPVLQIANTSYCNITTIRFPNLTVIVHNISMAKSGLEFSYLLKGGNTSTIGTYLVNGECDTTVWAYTFDVTNTGFSVETMGNNIIMMVFLFIMAIIFFIIGLQFDNKRWVIKTALFIIALIIMIMASNLALDYSLTNKENKMMFYAFLILIVSALLLFMYFFIFYTRQIIIAIKNARSEKEAELL